MKARIIGAAVLVAVLRSRRDERDRRHQAVDTPASPSGSRSTPSRAGRTSSRRPTQRSRSSTPASDVNVQYQNWGTHLGKFDATLAGGNTPDVIEMGNTEMTKYMAAGRVPGPHLGQVVVRQLEHAGSRASRPRAATTASSTASRTTRARASSPTAPTCSSQAGIKDPPKSLGAVHRGREEAEQEVRQEGLLAGLHRGHRLVRRDGLRLRLRRQDRHAGQRQVEGHARLAAVDRRPDRVQELLPGRLACARRPGRGPPDPVQRLRRRPRRLDRRARLVLLLRRRQVQDLDGAVRDAEPRRPASRCRASSAAPTSPSRSAGTSSSGRDWIAAFTSTVGREGAPGGREHPEHDHPPQHREGRTSGRPCAAGSSPLRRTGSTSRTGTSSAPCWPRS